MPPSLIVINVTLTDHANAALTGHPYAHTYVNPPQTCANLREPIANLRELTREPPQTHRKPARTGSQTSANPLRTCENHNQLANLRKPTANFCKPTANLRAARTSLQTSANQPRTCENQLVNLSANPALSPLRTCANQLANLCELTVNKPAANVLTVCELMPTITKVCVPNSLRAVLFQLFCTEHRKSRHRLYCVYRVVILCTVPYRHTESESET
jgi:hypothetical protein